MSDLRWIRWRRYPGGPLQKWHIGTTRRDRSVAMCGASPGEYWADGDARDLNDVPTRAVCATCKRMYPELEKQVKGWAG